jgi:hypothetical protein
LPVEEFPASLFLGPVQSFGEFTSGNGVNKRSELVIGQINAESLEPLRDLGSNSSQFFSKPWVLEERFHHFVRRGHT